ncbi:MAG: flavin reductase family protein [Defluviitaleaceae bacterium]|nr:flavin reductase family protein [Defluviitaleaceae bacterium]MCL2836461.1 flavin reductase family protein [Defluviitaleaceae bacterium]
MACIGGEKLTKDRIHAAKVFSANLVTEELLPLADYWGSADKHNKANVTSEVEKGSVLNVPILTKSPWVFELEVNQSVKLKDGEVFLCSIRNVLADELLCNENLSHEEKIKTIKPVQTVGGTYFAWNGDAIGIWGEPMKEIR